MKHLVQRLQLLPILALVVASVSLTAATCKPPDTSGYAEASQQYDADSAAYQAAGNELAKKSAERKLTTDQAQRFITIQAEVRTADNPVFEALQQWKASHVKPANFDALHQTLTDAQQKIIKLNAEVQ